MENKIYSSYFKFEKAPSKKTLFLLVERQGLFYEYLDNSKDKNGIGKIYFYDRPKNFKALKERQADKILQTTQKLTTSVFVPDLQNNLFGYGDIKDTNDLLLIKFNEKFTIIEIWVCPNHLNEKNTIFTLFVNGEIVKFSNV